MGLNKGISDYGVAWRFINACYQDQDGTVGQPNVTW